MLKIDRKRKGKKKVRNQSRTKKCSLMCSVWLWEGEERERE